MGSRGTGFGSRTGGSQMTLSKRGTGMQTLSQRGTGIYSKPQTTTTRTMLSRGSAMNKPGISSKGFGNKKPEEKKKAPVRTLTRRK